MQAVFSFGKHLRLRAFHHGITDLQPAIRRQAVQDDRVLRSFGQQGFIDAETGEFRQPFLLLGFLSHADPGIRVQHIRIANRFNRITGRLEIHLRHLRHDPVHLRAIQLIARRGGHDEPHSKLPARRRERSGDVIAIADVRHRLAFQRTEMLLDRHHIRHRLTRMAVVG